MKFLTIGWFGVLIALIIMNLYIGHCYERIEFINLVQPKRWVYRSIHICLSFVSLVYFYFFFKGVTDAWWMMYLRLIAAFYITFLHYAMLFYLIHDGLVFSVRFINYPESMRVHLKRIFFGGFLIFGVAALIAFVGIIHSQKLKITYYSVTRDAKTADKQHVRIAFLSDIHLGSSINRTNVEDLMRQTNAIDPDLIVLGGDVFDEGTTDLDKQKMVEALKILDATYGVVYVEGNHEYKSGDENITHQVSYFKEADITVLQDQVFEIPHVMTLLGRVDKVGHDAPFETIRKEVSSALPLVVIDHHPRYGETLHDGDVDVQLSGHTHSGQFFPMQWFNPLAMRFGKQLIYGHRHINNLDLFVSSGAGNWAIPVRIGSTREIMVVDINFE